MTPKEKAKHLVDRFRGYAWYDVNDKRAAQLSDELGNCKECALIAVDEVFQLNLPGLYTQQQYDSFSLYWQEVKKEIELI